MPTQTSTRTGLLLRRLLLRPAINRDTVTGGTYEFLAPEAMRWARRQDDEPVFVRESQEAHALGVMAYLPGG